MFELLSMKEAEALDAKSRAKVAELKHAYAMHEVKQAWQAQLDAFHADRARVDAAKAICANCGEKLYEGALYCVKCGAKVAVAENDIFLSLANPFLNTARCILGDEFGEDLGTRLLNQAAKAVVLKRHIKRRNRRQKLRSYPWPSHWHLRHPKLM